MWIGLELLGYWVGGIGQDGVTAASGASGAPPSREPLMVWPRC